MESRGPEDSKNVKTSQAYFFEGFISFFEDFSLTMCVISCLFVPLFIYDIWLVGYCLFERLSFLTNDLYTCIHL